MFPIKSIRTKTVISALIPMGLVLVAVAIIGLYGYEEVARDVVRQRDSELARVSASRLSEGLSQYSRILKNIAVGEDLRSMEPARLSSALEKAQFQLSVFDAGVVIYNSEGIALLSQQRTNFPITSKFAEARRTLRPIFSDIFKDEISGEDVILIGVPIVGNDGRLNGLLAGMSTIKYSLLGSIFAEVLEFKAGRSGHAYLVDGNGEVIYHRYISLIGKNLGIHVPVVQVTKGETGAVMAKDATGETIISGFAPVPGTGWGLITEERWKCIFGPIRGYSELLLGLLVVGGLLSGAAVFFSTGRILGPMKNLILGAQRIAEGDFDNTVVVKTSDEVEILAKQFNTMAGALKESFAKLEQRLVERKQAEKALRESEEKYRTLFEDSRDAIYINTREGKFVDVNQSMPDLFGYTRQEIMAKNNRELYADPDDRSRVLRVLEQKGYFRDYEIQYKKKDGTEMDCLITATVRRADDGSIIGYQGIIRDITERKKLQAQLERAQKMEVIGTLAGGVAHDLNNILSGLVSYPELLLLETPKDSPLRKPMLTIQKSGEKAAAIVQDLLTLSRRGVAVTEVVNLNHIISEYLKSPEHERLESFHPNVHVKTNLETDPLNILGSPAHLSKTVMNLVSNAAEAMPDGGEVSISRENLYIDQPIKGYDYVEEGDYVTLTVSDTGVGISKKDRERIFEPFYTKKVMGRSGTGLGMAVVWGTVKDHKGYIDIRSAKGKGATFTLYFPVTRKELPKDKSLLSIEDYMGKGESILVVDDVEEQREIASRILKKLGYSVTLVSSGEEAVDYLKDNPADLLLLDMIMDPGIDGLKTYKRILEFHPKQKAIIVSGFSETRRVKEAQRLGAGAYVKKPYLLEKIGIAVRDELNK